MTLRLSSLLSLLLPFYIYSAPLEDLVDYLPDYGPPPTTHFSGYLDGSKGCDTEANGKECKLHYWLALAEYNPWNASVVLWLNGGPGSSSLLGFLQENGPVLINATGGLMDNPWSWTKVANLLALESPVGVGYSYCSKQFEGEVCQNTDRFTASTSRAGLVDFFHKFPELASNDFFITGESYAGVYVPTLAQSILHDAPEINLVGIAVGDPCTDNTAQADSMDDLWYAGKYGFIDEAVFDTLWNKCGIRSPNIQARGGRHKLVTELNKKMRDDQLKVKEDKRRLAHTLLSGAKATSIRRGEEPDSLSKECSLALRKFCWSSSHAFSPWWDDIYVNEYSLFAPVTFQQDEEQAKYMMRADVRQALHTEEAPTPIWPDVDIGFDYTSEYDACNDNVTLQISMIDIYREIAPKLKISLVYNGDADPAVSYEGTRTAIKRVGFNEIDGGGYRPWFYAHAASPLSVLAEKAPLFGPNLLTVDVGAQMGGHVVDYEHGLSFVTVHGSGHMVPQFRPQAALHMMKKLVTFEIMSPLLPLNATLENMSDASFSATLDSWTEMAMALDK